MVKTTKIIIELIVIVVILPIIPLNITTYYITVYNKQSREVVGKMLIFTVF